MIRSINGVAVYEPLLSDDYQIKPLQS